MGDLELAIKIIACIGVLMLTLNLETDFKNKK